VGPTVGLDGHKTSSPSEFDPGPSSLSSVAIRTELPGPQILFISFPYSGTNFFIQKTCVNIASQSTTREQYLVIFSFTVQ